MKINVRNNHIIKIDMPQRQLINMLLEHNLPDPVITQVLLDGDQIRIMITSTEITETEEG